MAILSCTRRPVLPPPVAHPVAIEEAEQILDRLASEGAAVARYQAVVRIRGEGPDGRFSATQLLIFDRPDSVRIELLGAFGSTRWVAVTAQGEIMVWFPSRREYLRERRVADVVGVLLGLRLSPTEVMAVLAGTGLPLEEYHPVRASRQGALTRLELDGGMIELEGFQVRAAANAEYRISYPTSWKDEGKHVPYLVEISSEKLQATLRVESPDVNIRLHPEAFVVDLPDDANRLELHQVGDEAVFVKTHR